MYFSFRLRHNEKHTLRHIRNILINTLGTHVYTFRVRLFSFFILIAKEPILKSKIKNTG